MQEYSKTYLHKHFENFEFFDVECKDKRVREINMRIRRCLRCPGMEHCKWHPEFWLEGEAERLAEDLKLREFDKINFPESDEDSLSDEPEENETEESEN